MTDTTPKTERLPITTEELNQFFEDRGVKGECPSCGSNKWIPSAPPENGNLQGVGLMSVDQLSRQVWSSYVPAIALTCENCGYPRLFVWAVIEAWKKSKGSQS